MCICWVFWITNRSLSNWCPMGFWLDSNRRGAEVDFPQALKAVLEAEEVWSCLAFKSHGAEVWSGQLRKVSSSSKDIRIAETQSLWTLEQLLFLLFNLFNFSNLTQKWKSNKMFRWRSKVNIPILSFLFMFYHAKWSQHMSGQIAGSGRHPTWWLEITRWWYRDVFRGVPRTIVRTVQAYMVNVVGTLTVLQEILSRYVKVIFPSYVYCLINPMNTILTAVTIVRSIIHHRYGIYVHQFIYNKSAIIRWNPNCWLAKSQFKVLPTTGTHNSPKVPCITGRLRRPREYYRLLGTHTHIIYIYTYTIVYSHII